MIEHAVWLRVAGLLVAGLAVGGCGVTLQAKRVSVGDKAPANIPGDGIVYALPKTLLEIVQPVEFSVPAGGPLYGVLNKCLRACKATSNQVTDKSCDYSIEASLSFPPAEVRTVNAPDMSRLYQVSPDADFFQ